MMDVESLRGKCWKEVENLLRENCHALVFSGEVGTEIAKTSYEYGASAGTAVACAFAFMNENGAVSTAWRAVEIYEKISPHSMRNVSAMISYAGRGSRRIVWPITQKLRNKQRLAGFANVMMALAARELCEGTTCEKLASQGIMDFLIRGMKNITPDSV